MTIDIFCFYHWTLSHEKSEIIRFFFFTFISILESYYFLPHFTTMIAYPFKMLELYQHREFSFYLVFKSRMFNYLKSFVLQFVFTSSFAYYFFFPPPAFAITGAALLICLPSGIAKRTTGLSGPPYATSQRKKPFLSNCIT